MTRFSRRPQAVAPPAPPGDDAIEHGLLRIKVVRHGERLYQLELAGELDLSGVKLVEEQLRAAEVATEERIVVDLSGLEFIDTVGLSALQRSHLRQKDKPKRMQFVRPRGAAERVLKLTDMDRTLALVDDDARQQELV